MPYGYTRMKWRKRKDSPWWLFHFQLLRTWQQNFAHEESHENYTFLLQSPLWQLLWQKILNTDKPTNGYPNNWNFCSHRQERRYHTERLYIFSLLKNHILNHTLLTAVLSTPACWQATKSPSVSPQFIYSNYFDHYNPNFTF